MKKVDYRHYICIAVTLAFFAVSIFVFPLAAGRIGEATMDVANSFAFYFEVLVSGESDRNVTVNDFTQYFEMPFDLPDTWEEFVQLFDDYWQVWASWDNVNAYMSFLLDCCMYVAYFVLYALPVFCVVLIVVRLGGRKQNNKYNKDSRALCRFKKICKQVYSPAKEWCSRFLLFLRQHRYYGRLWLALWLYNFNVFAMAFSAVAYYLYFVASFDVVSLYRQALKLLMDLSVAIDFIPLVGWLIIFAVITDRLRRRIGYDRMERYELRNRGFINERPIVVMVCGTMGKKKTTMITDMALSQEIMFRDKAFEKLLQTDLKFPFFPWINLENEVQHAMRVHFVYNLATCRRFIRQCKRAWQKGKNAIFGYDYKRYGVTHDNGLYVENIWDAINNYAQLYFIYVIQSSLIISNYSIRTDAVLNSVGNFPLWHADLFRSDSRMQAAFSRHSHILDFDSLRLGRRIVEQNKYADSFEFGVLNITEIGKERGNNLELQEKKKSAAETNQKNDLFNYTLKMIRHSATVDNFPFVKVIVDEQRPESWGADARDLCEIVHIDECSDMRLSMPLFGLGDWLISKLVCWFQKSYYEYRYDRGDNTLPMYLCHGAVALLDKYRSGIYNRFGYMQLDVSVEDGTQSGERKAKKYYLMSKKIYSKRFSTDAFSDYFNQKALTSPVGIDDLREFASEKATWAELTSENSYFFNDLTKIKQKHIEKGEDK